METRTDTFTYNLSEVTGERLDAITNPDSEGHAAVIEQMGLTTKRVTWKDNAYMVVKYDKSKLTPDTIQSSGMFRSVVVSLNDNRIVSFAPPKSVSYQEFSRVPGDWQETRLEEFVEGTMMNLFYVEGEWEMATRSMVGANGRFYNDGGKDTFRSMFLDAVNVCASNGQSAEVFYSRLDPRLCYSFVFQHPNNQIVTPNAKPELYLIRAYLVENGIVTEFLPTSPEVRAITRCDDASITIDSPYAYETSTWQDFDELKAEWSTMNRVHTDMGVVLVNPQRSIRTKLRNPTFEMVRNLRGNQPKLQYQYLALRKEGKVGQYLRYYKQASAEFTKYRQQLHTFTDTLHTNYIGCFVKKEQSLKEYPAQFKTHMYALHGMFLQSLRPNGECVSMRVVIDYVNSLPTPRLMYSLNWHPRKNVLMEKNVDMELSSASPAVVLE